MARTQTNTVSFKSILGDKKSEPKNSSDFVKHGSAHLDWIEWNQMLIELRKIRDLAHEIATFNQ